MKRTKCQSLNPLTMKLYGHIDNFIESESNGSWFRCRRCGHYTFTDKVVSADAGWHAKKEADRKKALAKRRKAA